MSELPSISVLDVQKILRDHEDEFGHSVTSKAPQVLLDGRPAGMAVHTRLWIPGFGEHAKSPRLTSYTKTAEAPILSEIESGHEVGTIRGESGTGRLVAPMYPHIYHTGSGDNHYYNAMYDESPWGPEDIETFEDNILPIGKKLIHPSAPHGPLSEHELNPDIHNALKNHSLLTPPHIGTRDFEHSRNRMPYLYGESGYIKKDELHHFNEKEAYRNLIEFTDEDNPVRRAVDLGEIIKPFSGLTHVRHTYYQPEASDYSNGGVDPHNAYYEHEYVYDPRNETLHRVRAVVTSGTGRRSRKRLL